MDQIQDFWKNLYLVGGQVPLTHMISFELEDTVLLYRITGRIAMRPRWQSISY